MVLIARVFMSICKLGAITASLELLVFGSSLAVRNAEMGEQKPCPMLKVSTLLSSNSFP